MIELMAERARGQAFPLDLEELTVAVLCTDFDVLGTRDNAEFTRHTEASLCADLLAVRLDNDGIDKLDHIFFLILRDVRFQNDHSPAKDADLRRGKTDAVGMRKRFLLLISLSMIGVEYFTWVRRSAALFAVNLLLVLGFIVLGVAIAY